MQAEPHELSCWKCGANLKSVPRPFSRFAECPECKTDLHVCRMCRYYDLRYVGQCSHDFADKVLVKDKSNFCSHFRPDPNAYQGRGDAEKEKAQQELQSLFGPADNPGDQPESEQPESDADTAKKKLNDLFGDD